MKYLLIITLCLLNFSVFAQQGTDTVPENKRYRENSPALESFEQKFKRTEAELDELVKLYTEVSDQERKLLEAKCKTYLFQLFDLSIEKKEEEIVQLQSELEKIGKRDQNIDKFNDLIAIKEEIDLVQDEIFKRKKHRDTIVANRLKEILNSQ